MPEIRTWTLDWQMGPARLTGPKELAGDKSVRVVEAEPVAELLEDAEDFLETVTQWTGSDPDELQELRESLRALSDSLRTDA